MFLPKPLDDDWTRWIVGEWEGSGDSTAGKGKGTSKIELGLNGQFLICSGQAELTEINAEYLKKNMQASDEEIERFKSSPYKALEIYTADKKNGDIVGYLFDSLRCMAQGRGKREGNKETIEWQWINGQKSTRITEKISDDKMAVIEKTPMPDGSTMEDKGEMIRIKKEDKGARNH
ncbi:MAG: hypothetical protein ABSG67_20460 [Thermoguttaceae bacterium]